MKKDLRPDVLITNGDSGFMANGGDRKRDIVADGITKMDETEE